MRLSGPENRTSPLCESARGSASAWSSWTAVSWGRDSGVWDRGWAGGRHPSWGRGSNGCKSLTRSELAGPFLWLLFPATSSPLSVERERSRPAPRWRPRRWTRGSSSELEWITSFYYPHNPIWHSGDGLPGLSPRGKGLDKLEWPAAQRQGTREGRKRKIALFSRMFVFYFFHCHSRRLHGRLYGPCSNKHNSLCTRKRTGWKEVLKRGLLVGGPAVAGLDSLLFLSCRSGGRHLGSGALTLRKGVASGWAWTPSRLLSLGRLRGGNGRCRLRGLLSRRSLKATLSSCWAGALDRKCRITCDAFCASVKRSANPFTAGPKRPLGEIGASRKETLSVSLISVSVSHRWRSSTTRPAIDLPMAWAVVWLAKPGLLHFSAFWRNLAGFVAIGSCSSAADPLVRFLPLHEPIVVQFHCVIE